TTHRTSHLLFSAPPLPPPTPTPFPYTTLFRSRERHIDLVIVGPEAPLAGGVTDALRAAGLKVFGPTCAAAQIEASKPFAKDFMEIGRATSELQSHLNLVCRLLLEKKNI